MRKHSSDFTFGGFLHENVSNIRNSTPLGSADVNIDGKKVWVLTARPPENSEDFFPTPRLKSETSEASPVTASETAVVLGALEQIVPRVRELVAGE